MKLKDLKHDHSLTNLLKVIIFSILMLTPFFYVATKCLYVVCNKNAHESYSGNTNTTYETISNIDNLQIGKRYVLNSILGTYTDSSTHNTGKIFYSNAKVVATYNSTAQNTLNNGNNFVFYYSNDAISIYVYNNTTNVDNWTVTRNYTLSFEFTLESYNKTNLENNYTFIRYINETNASYLDNVFEYSVNQMAQSQLFTWTQNTGVYTGANAMTTGLGLTSPVIPILISYWFLLTIIYVVIDIVIVCFTTITHMIVKKSN